MTSEPSALQHLGDGQYVLVTTYRRNGTPVPTPVWVVRDGAALGVWTPTKSGKIKRIRRNPVVTVAPCTFRGEALGDAVPGRAELLDQVGTGRVRRLLQAKYGLIARLTVLGSLMRRGRDGTIGVQITLTPQD